jgi:hypothetical protein
MANNRGTLPEHTQTINESIKPEYENNKDLYNAPDTRSVNVAGPGK